MEIDFSGIDRMWREAHDKAAAEMGMTPQQYDEYLTRKKQEEWERQEREQEAWKRQQKQEERIRKKKQKFALQDAVRYACWLIQKNGYAYKYIKMAANKYGVNHEEVQSCVGHRGGTKSKRRR